MTYPSLLDNIGCVNSNFPPIFYYRGDSGTYTCEAQNEYGKSESSGDLFVKQGPTFQVCTLNNWPLTWVTPLM